MEPIQKVYRPTRRMLWDNFLGGISWALGVTVGLSIIFGALGYIGGKVNWIPVVGKVFSDLTQSIENNRPTVGPKKAAPQDQ
jgi:hypothetical protein